MSKQFSARCVSFTTLIKITRQNFIDLVKSTSELDYERFCFIKDMVLFNANYD